MATKRISISLALAGMLLCAPVGCGGQPAMGQRQTSHRAMKKRAVQTVQVETSGIDRAEALRETVGTDYPALKGRTINVPAGGDLRQAIASAQPGDEIVLQAGAEYRGNFTLPLKDGEGWIVIRSSALKSLPEGKRVKPEDAQHMAKIVGGTDGYPFATGPRARMWRLAGLEITVDPATRNNYGLTRLGTGEETTFDQLTSDIVIDRSYLHGTPTCNCVRAVVFHGARQAVVDSYINEIHSNAQDSQAVMGYNGPGPFKIHNNHLEASGENIMFGGADPKLVFRGRVTGTPTRNTAVLSGMPPLDEGTPLMFTVQGKTGRTGYTAVRGVEGEEFTFDDLAQAPDADSQAWFGVVPSDIEITRNTFFKPLTWKSDDASYAGQRWIMKNLLELKSGQRVHVEGNWFENSWPAAQSGIGLLIASTNQDGDCPYCIVQDVVLRNNVVRNTNWAVVLLGHQSAVRPALQPANTRRIELVNNMFYPSYRLFTFLQEPMAVRLEFNTGFATNNTMLTDAENNPVNEGLVIVGNLLERSVYGMSSGGKEGLGFLQQFFSPLVNQGNAIINTSKGTEQEFSDEVLTRRYGPDFVVISNLQWAGFAGASFSGRDLEGFMLTSNSPLSGKAPGGKNYGADINAIMRALPSPIFPEQAPATTP